MPSVPFAIPNLCASDVFCQKLVSLAACMKRVARASVQNALRGFLMFSLAVLGEMSGLSFILANSV